MGNFKLSLACLCVLQVINGYAVAADYDAAQDGVIGTDMSFSGTDKVSANIKDTFSPETTTNFADNSVLTVSVAQGLSAGAQNFGGTSSIVASATHAISGGVQNFWNSSHLRVKEINALSGSQINLHDTSDIKLEGVDLASNTLGVNLIDAGTELDVSGKSAALGKLEGKGKVIFGSAASGRLIIDTSVLGDSTFDGVLDTSANNNAELIKEGRGEWIFNGTTSGPGGKASVNGGLMTVNGDLSAFSVAVKQGASLGGTGKVGSTTVATGGGIGSGASKGTLSVMGDLKLEQGSTLYVNADSSGKAGLIDVSKTVTVDRAFVQVLADSGRYAPSTRFTILKATDGITGKFFNAYTDLYFLNAILHHNANSVEVELVRNGQAISSAAHNPSAVNVAHAIGDHTPDLLDHLLASSATTAGRALDQLAVAANASRAAALLGSTAQVSGTLLNAMNQLNEFDHSLQASMLLAEGPALVATGTPASARGLQDPQGAGRLWIQGLGSRGNFDGTHATNDIQQHTSGALVGMDWAANETWRLGVMGGYSTTQLEAKDFLNDSLDSYHLGAYARHRGDVLVTRMGLAYSGHQGNAKREVDFNGFHDTPKGRYDASNQQAFIEFALPTTSGSLYKEPFASLGYQRYSSDAYDEKGGAAALHVDGQQQSNLISTLGLRVARQRVLDNGMTLTPRASLGWRHTYGDTEISTRQAFITGGSTFDVYGSNLDRNTVMTEAGVDLGISATQNVSLNYAGEFGTNARNHGLAAEWRWRF